jgi:hypothetical protein
MQPDIWANSGAERPLKYSELFCTADIAEVVARETYWHAKNILENT